MNSTFLDKACGIWIGSALVLWTACLTVLWGGALDSSGASALLTAAATLLAVSLAVLTPLPVARAVQRVLIWMRLLDVAAMELAQAGAGPFGQIEARAMARLLGIVTACGVAGGLASTLAIPLARSLADWLAGSLLWSPPAWAAMKLLLQLAGMLPIAAGMAVVFLSTALLRGGSRRDAYAAVCRQWLWAVAGGLAAFAAAVQAQADLLGVALAAAILLAATAGALLARRKAAPRPLRWTVPVEDPARRRQELKVLVGWAALTMVLLLQLRLLADAAGAHLPLRMFCLAGSLAALATMLTRMDRRGHLPSSTQQAGAWIALVFAGLFQAMLALVAGGAASSGRDDLAVAAGALALAAQGPLLALVAGVLSSQRRALALAGGRARVYASSAALGAALGCLGNVLIFATGAGGVILMAGALAVLAGAAVAGIRAARNTTVQLQWACAGIVLMCALAAGTMLAARRAFGPRASLTPGVWLTGLAGRAPGGPLVRIGVLPRPSAWRSDALTFAMAEMMNGPNRRWWLVSTSDLDLPGGLVRYVPAAGAAPDPAALPRQAEADFLQALQISHRRYDGILLAPLPADHPHAWRCYNRQTIRRCLALTNGQGLLLMRTQAGSGYFAAALSAAKAFHQAVGPSWALAELSGGRLDLLLAGPASALPGPPLAAVRGVFLVPTERILQDWPAIPAVSLAQPGAMRRQGQPNAADLDYWLLSRAVPASGGDSVTPHGPAGEPTTTAPQEER